MADERPVLVTGASGFIATHVIQQLQRAGYRVRGTVRSSKNEEKVRPLRDLCPDAKYPLELYEADLTRDEGWKDAVDGCQYVLHTASPFPIENPADENELIRPAVDGTLSVLRACRGSGVKRVVVTSSCAAIASGTVSGKFSEEDWIDIDATGMAYYKSKAMAEKAAWDFVDGLDDADKFELAVVNPILVMGPVLCGGWASSMEFPKRLLERQIPALGQLNAGIVDVRDVAAAHLAAMTEPEAAGHRHILSSGNLWLKEIAEILDEEFRPLGYNVPLFVAPYLVVRIMAICDKTTRDILPMWGQVLDMNNTRMKTVLKISPRPLKESIIDQAYSMIEKGFVKKTEKYIEVKGNKKQN